MKRRELKCMRCGYAFEHEVLEEGEAQRRKIMPQPLYCPKCGGRVKMV